jgi:hypothetical protein
MRIFDFQVAAVAVSAFLVGAGLTLMVKPERQRLVLPPPRAAETACHLDLRALQVTLPYVPISTHERKAAHTLLRAAYREPDDQKCREKAGLIVERAMWNLRRDEAIKAMEAAEHAPPASIRTLSVPELCKNAGDGCSAHSDAYFEDAAANAGKH